MSQGVLRSPAQPSEVRTVRQLHLWLSSSCRLRASSRQLRSWNHVSLQTKTPPPRQFPISWQTESPSAFSTLLKSGFPRVVLQDGRETALIAGSNLSLSGGHAVWRILLLSLKREDRIAYVFLILLPPVAGPEIARNPHIRHAYRISFS